MLAKLGPAPKPLTVERKAQSLQSRRCGTKRHAPPNGLNAAVREPYYITTAISYPNGRPHIGHAYESDRGGYDRAVSQRAMGTRCCASRRGTDEHGLKMAQAARARDITPRALADEMSSYFNEMCDTLNISYDRFIRTSDTDHYAASQAIWQAMEANGRSLSRSRVMEGWYSVRDEAFYDEKELIDGEGDEKLSPQGTPVEWTKARRAGSSSSPNIRSRCSHLYRDQPGLHPAGNAEERDRQLRLGRPERSVGLAHQLRLGRAGAGQPGACHVCLGRRADQLSDRDRLS